MGIFHPVNGPRAFMTPVQLSCLEKCQGRAGIVSIKGFISIE
jgi:hypothetical protein